MMLPFDLTPLTAACMAVVLLVAAFVRGYSGFGFSALVVTGASLVTNPLNFVPVVICCEILMTVQQWRGIGKDVAWRRLGALIFGGAFGLPLGLWAITQVPVDTARAMIALYVLVMCVLLLRGWRITRAQGLAAHSGVGVIAGLANAVAMGGLPVATYFTAQAMQAHRFRATLVAYATAIDLFTLPFLWWHGLISGGTGFVVLVALPLLVLGIMLGSKQFLAANPQEFRRFATLLLAVLAGFGLLKSLR